MVDRNVKVRLSAEVSPFVRGMSEAAAAVKGLDSQISKANDRTAWLAQGILGLAPALVPLGAAAVPALAGVATQATIAAGAVGTMALAFHGVGDGLKALNTYQAAPTVQNLQKLQQAMDALGPDGAQFVRDLDEAGQHLSSLQMTARAGMFPGIETGIDRLLARLPDAQRIVQQIASGIGELAREAGQGISGPEWDSFFEFLKRDAKPILLDMGRTIGNVAAGFAHLLTAFAPLSRSFSDGMLSMSRAFDEWAAGLAGSRGFEDFLSYVQDAGPKALAFLESLGHLLVAVTKAVAPLGSKTLPVLTELVKVLADLAATPVGQFALIAASLASLWGRMRALQSLAGKGAGGMFFAPVTASAAPLRTASGQIRTSLGQIAAVWATAGARTERESARMAEAQRGLRTGLSDTARAVGPAAKQLGLLGVAMSPLPQKMGLSNTVMGAMVGSILPGYGTAIGAAVGYVMDFAAANNDLNDSLNAVRESLQSGAPSEQSMQLLTAAKQNLSELQNQVQTGRSPYAMLLHPNDFQKASSDWIHDMFGSSDIENAQKQVADLTQRVNAQRAAENKAAKQKAWQDHLASIRQANQQTADSFIDLANDMKKPTTSLDDMVRRLRNQATAELNEAGNIKAAVQRGLDPKYVQKIVAALGPQGASLVFQQLAHSSKQAIDQVNADFGRANRAAKTFGSTMEGVSVKVRHDWKDQLSNVANAHPTQFTKFAIDQASYADALDKVDKFKSRLDKLPPSVQSQIKMMGMPQTIGDIDKIGNLLDLTAKERKALLVLVDHASPGIRNVKALLDSVNSKTITLTTVHRTVSSKVGGGALAGGGTVPGPRQPYGDKVLTMLAPGEEVITNRHGEADRFRRDRALGLIPGYADGGTIDPRTTHTHDGHQFSPWATPAELKLWGELNVAVGELKDHLHDATKQLDRENSARSALVDKMHTLSSDVQSGLRSDLFSTDANVWASQYGGTSPAGVMATLRGDITKGKQENAAIAALRKKGVNGDALAAILSQGGLAGAKAFAGLSKSELAQYERLYKTRDRVLHRAGAAASSTAYGAQLHTETKQFRELRAEVVKLRHAVERADKHNQHGHQGTANSMKKGASSAGRRNGRRP